MKRRALYPQPWWLHDDLTFWAPLCDPANPLAICRGTGPLTFTRAHDATHTATYVHPGTGLVTVASADQLRIEAAGALIELAGKNYATHSEALDNAVWTPSPGCSIAASAAVDPAGGVGAFDITDNDAGQFGELMRTGGGVVPIDANTDVYIMSVFIKKTTGAIVFPGFGFQLTGGTGVNAHATLNTNTGAVTPRTAVPATVYGSEDAGDYWRVYAGKANNMNTLAMLEIFPAVALSADPGSWVPDPIGTITAYGVQMEKSPNMTSYIPSVATAMLRNKDVLTAPRDGNVSANPGSLTMCAEVVRKTPAVTDLYYFILTETPSVVGGVDVSYKNDVGHFRFVASDTYDASAMLSNGTKYKVGIRHTQGLKTDAFVNGVKTAGTVNDTRDTTATTIGIGNSGGVNQLQGHIKNIRIWNRALTDAEMQNLTR